MPSLTYLFRLVLTGRFDPAAPLKAAHQGKATPADATPSRSARTGGAAIPSGALLALGAAITFLSDNLLRGLGVTLMLAGAIVLFTQLAALDDDV